MGTVMRMSPSMDGECNPGPGIHSRQFFIYLCVVPQIVVKEMEKPSFILSIGTLKAKL